MLTSVITHPEVISVIEKQRITASILLLLINFPYFYCFDM